MEKDHLRPSRCKSKELEGHFPLYREIELAIFLVCWMMRHRYSYTPGRLRNIEGFIILRWPCPQVEGKERIKNVIMQDLAQKGNG
jgi:hypothetical protein